MILPMFRCWQIAWIIIFLTRIMNSRCNPPFSSYLPTEKFGAKDFEKSDGFVCQCGCILREYTLDSFPDSTKKNVQARVRMPGGTYFGWEIRAIPIAVNRMMMDYVSLIDSLPLYALRFDNWRLAEFNGVMAVTVPSTLKADQASWYLDWKTKGEYTKYKTAAEYTGIADYKKEKQKLEKEHRITPGEEKRQLLIMSDSMQGTRTGEQKKELYDGACRHACLYDGFQTGNKWQERVGYGIAERVEDIYTPSVVRQDEIVDGTTHNGYFREFLTKLAYIAKSYYKDKVPSGDDAGLRGLGFIQLGATEDTSNSFIQLGDGGAGNGNYTSPYDIQRDARIPTCRDVSMQMPLWAQPTSWSLLEKTYNVTRAKFTGAPHFMGLGQGFFPHVYPHQQPWIAPTPTQQPLTPPTPTQQPLTPPTPTQPPPWIPFAPTQPPPLIPFAPTQQQARPNFFFPPPTGGFGGGAFIQVHDHLHTDSGVSFLQSDMDVKVAPPIQLPPDHPAYDPSKVIADFLASISVYPLYWPRGTAKNGGKSERQMRFDAVHRPVSKRLFVLPITPTYSMKAVVIREATTGVTALTSAYIGKMTKFPGSSSDAFEYLGFPIGDDQKKQLTRHVSEQILEWTRLSLAPLFSKAITVPIGVAGGTNIVLGGGGQPKIVGMEVTPFGPPKAEPKVMIDHDLDVVLDNVPEKPQPSVPPPEAQQPPPVPPLQETPPPVPPPQETPPPVPLPQETPPPVYPPPVPPQAQAQQPPPVPPQAQAPQFLPAQLPPLVQPLHGQPLHGQPLLGPPYGAGPYWPAAFLQTSKVTSKNDREEDEKVESIVGADSKPTPKDDADAPAENAPAENAPAENAPAENAPAENAPAENAPAENAPAENAPAENAPAENAPARSEATKVKAIAEPPPAPSPKPPPLPVTLPPLEKSNLQETELNPDWVSPSAIPGQGLDKSSIPKDFHADAVIKLEFMYEVSLYSVCWAYHDGKDVRVGNRIVAVAKPNEVFMFSAEDESFIHRPLPDSDSRVIHMFPGEGTRQVVENNLPTFLDDMGTHHPNSYKILMRIIRDVFRLGADDASKNRVFERNTCLLDGGVRDVAFESHSESLMLNLYDYDVLEGFYRKQVKLAGKRLIGAVGTLLEMCYGRALPGSIVKSAKLQKKWRCVDFPEENRYGFAEIQ